jgi:addiction module HigA family antidote
MLLKEEFIDGYNLTVKETAELLGVTKANLSEIINLKRGISWEMAIRISNMFGGSPGLWVKLQREYDLDKPNKALKSPMNRG